MHGGRKKKNWERKKAKRKGIVAWENVTGNQEKGRGKEIGAGKEM